MSYQEEPFDYVENDFRLTTYPIQHPHLFELYKKLSSNFWAAEEIELGNEAGDFKRLHPMAQRAVKYILAFFAASDGIVNINLIERFRDEVKFLEARYFYDYQIANENVHAETYSLLLDTIIVDVDEKRQLFDAIRTMPVIKKMADYMYNCIKSDSSLAERLLRMACVEGIFFTGCFCFIYWLAQEKIMPGLAQSNIWISRDEAQHTEFALALYQMIKPSQRLSPEKIYEIFDEAVQIACEFTREALFDNASEGGLEQMNASLMMQYIQHQANNILSLIGVGKLYNVDNPFAFMEQINLVPKTNQFETRSTEYSKPTTMVKSEDNGTSITSEF